MVNAQSMEAQKTEWKLPTVIKIKYRDPLKIPELDVRAGAQKWKFSLTSRSQ